MLIIYFSKQIVWHVHKFAYAFFEQTKANRSYAVYYGKFAKTHKYFVT